MSEQTNHRLAFFCFVGLFRYGRKENRETICTNNTSSGVFMFIQIFDLFLSPLSNYNRTTFAYRLWLSLTWVFQVHHHQQVGIELANNNQHYHLMMVQVYFLSFFFRVNTKWSLKLKKKHSKITQRVAYHFFSENKVEWKSIEFFHCCIGGG